MSSERQAIMMHMTKDDWTAEESHSRPSFSKMLILPTINIHISLEKKKKKSITDWFF